MNKLTRNFLFVFFSSVLLSINSQNVGINTISPQKLFHIDGKKNTIGVVDVSDDVVIDGNGNVGVGNINPQAKLDITKRTSTTSGFRLEDGTAQASYILTSDNDGYGTWQLKPKSGENFQWKISNTSFYLSATETKFVGTTSTWGALPGFTTKPATSELLIPKGKYIISVYGDFNGWEYMQLRIFGVSSLYPTGEYLSSIVFRSYLNATSDFFDIEEDTTISFRVRGFDARTVFWAPSFNSPNFNVNANMYFQVFFLRVS